jgi:hypothetical protein
MVSQALLDGCCIAGRFWIECMDLIAQEARSNIERWSILAAIFAAAFNILSWLVLNYQIYAVDLCFQHRAIVMNYPYRAPVTDYSHIFFQFVFLTPVFVVGIFYRYLPLTLTYDFVLFTILVGRIYYLVQFYRIGLGAVSKFDPPQLLWTILGAVSAAVVVFWMMIRLAIFLNDTRKNQNGAALHVGTAKERLLANGWPAWMW